MYWNIFICLFSFIRFKAYSSSEESDTEDGSSDKEESNSDNPKGDKNVFLATTCLLPGTLSKSFNIC